MKTLVPIILSFYFLTSLSAQDTLFIQGKSKPLLCEIVKIKNKTILYKRQNAKTDRVLSMKRDRVMRYAFEITKEERAARAAELAELQAPFIRKNNTIYMSSRGILGLRNLGLNIHRNLYTSPNQITNIGVIAGGGLINLGETDDDFKPRGSYFELGARTEFGASRIMFHTGLSGTFQFFETDIAPLVPRNLVHIPFGITYRNNQGAFLAIGGEFSSEAWAQPAVKLEFGWSF